MKEIVVTKNKITREDKLEAFQLIFVESLKNYLITVCDNITPEYIYYGNENCTCIISFCDCKESYCYDPRITINERSIKLFRMNIPVRHVIDHIDLYNECFTQVTIYRNKFKRNIDQVFTCIECDTDSVLYDYDIFFKSNNDFIVKMFTHGEHDDSEGLPQFRSNKYMKIQKISWNRYYEKRIYFLDFNAFEWRIGINYSSCPYKNINILDEYTLIPCNIDEIERKYENIDDIIISYLIDENKSGYENVYDIIILNNEKLILNISVKRTLMVEDIISMEEINNIILMHLCPKYNVNSNYNVVLIDQKYKTVDKMPINQYINKYIN